MFMMRTMAQGTVCMQWHEEAVKSGTGVFLHSKEKVMFDYLLTEAQIALREELREFIKWVPRRNQRGHVHDRGP